METRKDRFFILILIVLQLGLLIIFGSFKKGMHFDECFSYFNTNNSVGRQAYDREFVKSEDIMKDFYVLKGEGFNYPYVVKLQSYDVHPPVFYILLHTLCSFMPGVFSIWQGIALNILYALLTSFFSYLILKRISGNSLFSFILCIISVLNPGVISNVMYIRMYCLMTLWMMISIYLHIRMNDYGKFNEVKWYYILLSSIVTYLGFLTHYFYLVFLFLLEAAFFIPKLFKFKDNYKGIIKYAGSILIAGILGVVSYPSCLGHVNSGYRGQEVKGNLADVSDFGMRLKFFGGLLNKYVFCNLGYVLMLLIVCLLIYSYYRSKKTGVAYEKTEVKISCLAVPVAGYFLVSAKASLLGDEAMMRYQLPIYGLTVMICGILIYDCIKACVHNERLKKIICIALAVLILIPEIIFLFEKNVFYLYEEQERMEEIARANKDDTCLYIYNNEQNKYLLWNDAMQLKEYHEVYFANFENQDEIEEEKIKNAEKLVVYVSTLGEDEDFSKYETFIKNTNQKVKNCKKLYDAMYATAYLFE